MSNDTQLSYNHYYYYHHYLYIFCFFFFFQAEDGIRDGHVTGVQTCALPICSRREVPGADGARRLRGLRRPDRPGAATVPRSEERRVGKECRSRWSAYH